jgi:hypothetical protein
MDKFVFPIAIFFAIALTSANIAYSQGLSARGNSGNADFSRFEEKLRTLQNQLDSTTKTLAAVNKCLGDGFFYRPTSSDADINGCVKEDDPQVGNMAAGLVCTTDGEKVNCGYDLAAELAAMKDDIEAALASLLDIRQNVLPSLESKLQTEFRAELAALDASLRKLLTETTTNILQSITGIYAEIETIDNLLNQNSGKLGDAFGQIKSANDKIRELVDRLSALIAGNTPPVCVGMGSSLQYDGAKWSCLNTDPCRDSRASVGMACLGGAIFEGTINTNGKITKYMSASDNPTKDYYSGGGYLGNLPLNFHDAKPFCDALFSRGYDDWYLPSRDELVEIFKTGHQDAGVFWVSTEGSGERTWGVSLGNNVGEQHVAFTPRNVRINIWGQHHKTFGRLTTMCVRKF